MQENSRRRTRTEPVMQTTVSEAKLFHTVKELAQALTRSEDYVGDMRKGGLRLPCTLAEAVEFIRQNGPPRRHRRTRSELYGHIRPSCPQQDSGPLH